MSAVLALAPRSDLASNAQSYRELGRCQIRDLFAEESADAIAADLQEHTPWGLCFNQGERVAALRATDVAGLSDEKRSQIAAAVSTGARQGFQFFYQHFPLFTDYFDGNRATVPLFTLFEFINSAPFLDLMRELTGAADIAWADAHATCYRPGHFLMRHNDEMPGSERRAAYVLNFTRDWRADWGGYLQFFDEAGDVAHAYRPLFNAVNVFAVPQEHSVEAVSPFAPAPRLSVTGWLRADQPPGPIGDR